MAEKEKFLRRISPELWAQVESWSQAEFRSVNGQIEYILRDAVKHRKRKANARGQGCPDVPSPNSRGWRPNGPGLDRDIKGPARALCPSAK